MATVDLEILLLACRDHGQNVSTWTTKMPLALNILPLWLSQAGLMSCMLRELVAMNLGVGEVASSGETRIEKAWREMAKAMSIKKSRLRRAWIATDTP